MMQSMTAFARVQKQLDSGSFSWEIRTVNHRYLDISFRLPDAFRFLENALRGQLRGKLQRGKLECYLKYQDFANENSEVVVNYPLIDKLLQIGEDLAQSKQVPNDLTLSTLLAWPNVVQNAQLNVEDLSKEVESLFQCALQELVSMRKTEGMALKTHIQSRLDKLSITLQQAKQQSSDSLSQTREKWQARLSTVAIEVDPARLEQEVAILLTRLDVNEELERLETHIIEVAKTLEANEPSGRRLDFLMQELNREANTLSSKSDSVALTQSAVEMKVLIEQMREQIQNIE